MNRFLAAAVGLVAFGIAGQASAADLPPAVPYARAPMIPAFYDWSGFYTGLNGGWGWSNNCWTLPDATGAFTVADSCHNAASGFGGGQIGYRLQNGGFVFGAEVQGDWANLRGSSLSLVNPANTNNTRIDSFGLFTGQVGYAYDTALFYVKGGGAVAGNRFSITATAGNAPVATAGTQSRWGGTVGAGIEYSFAPDWSVAVEYDHLFMPDRQGTFFTPTGALFSTENLRQSVDLLSVRINYRWGGPVLAKY
jgi:outer membrane immunogenic protein